MDSPAGIETGSQVAEDDRGPAPATLADLARSAERLMALAAPRGLTLVAAESCTAGLLAQILCDAPGASSRFHGSFVTYTKLQKAHVLGVSAELLRCKGAVCVEVAGAMAAGALAHSPADIAAAITGVAGPEPDEDGNPVGRVCIAIAARGRPTEAFGRLYADHGRDAIRRRAVADALAALAASIAAAPAA
ncbi:MAG TPA: nicotinamide-nucleotide amidohydrolase family protein [Xanthobacteraceae bacterium]|nr:nicotinamide-nucleotide amidohydrolase family protein [Xanthobacteraceae bacterium]